MEIYGNTFTKLSWWKRTKNTLRWHGMEIVIVTAIVLIVVLFGWGAVYEAQEKEKARKAFMFECTKDHKEYECTAMWRAGEPKTVIVPINTTTVR